MAQVTVRVKIDKEFEVFCSGTNEDEVLDDIFELSRLDSKVLDELAGHVTVVEATYDEPDDDEDDLDVDDDAGGAD